MISSIGNSDPSTMMSAIAAKMFKRLDTNEDGGIDKTEMQAMIDQGQGCGPSIDEIFEKFDTDNDGKISEEEHEKAMVQRRAEMEQMRAAMQNRISGSDRTNDMFAKLDTNGDGGLDRDEIAALLVTDPRKMLQQVSYDQNGDSNRLTNTSGVLVNTLA